MKMTAAHWSAILEFHRTHNLTETAKRFALTAAGLIYWKRKFGIVPERQRFGGDELDEMEDTPIPKKEKVRERRLPAPLACWSYPRPAEEARFLLGIADRNGGRESMRRLISVTPEQRADLERLAALGQVSIKRVERALEFRRQVLDAFDKFGAACSGPAVVDRRKLRASRYCRPQPRISIEAVM